MKTFNLALLTAMASASDYSLTRSRGDPVRYDLIASATNTPTDLTWYMMVQSVYDNDTGYEWIEIEHVLNADIKQTDLISFELGFTSQNDPWIDRQNVIAYDSAVCKLATNAADDRFWIQTAEDKLYTCADQTCLTGTQTWASDTTNDWKAGVNWEEDDDKDSPFCTAHTDTDNFKCSQIKCKYRRKMDTEDA